MLFFIFWNAVLWPFPPGTFFLYILSQFKASVPSGKHSWCAQPLWQGHICPYCHLRYVPMTRGCLLLNAVSPRGLVLCVCSPSHALWSAPTEALDKLLFSKGTLTFLAPVPLSPVWNSETIFQGDKWLLEKTISNCKLSFHLIVHCSKLVFQYTWKIHTYSLRIGKFLKYNNSLLLMITWEVGSYVLRSLEQASYIWNFEKILSHELLEVCLIFLIILFF